MEFVTDLKFPHAEADTAVPHAWIDDAPTPPTSMRLASWCVVRGKRVRTAMLD